MFERAKLKGRRKPFEEGGKDGKGCAHEQRSEARYFGRKASGGGEGQGRGKDPGLGGERRVRGNDTRCTKTRLGELRLSFPPSPFSHDDAPRILIFRLLYDFHDHFNEFTSLSSFHLCLSDLWVAMFVLSKIKVSSRLSLTLPSLRCVFHQSSSSHRHPSCRCRTLSPFSPWSLSSLLMLPSTPTSTRSTQTRSFNRSGSAWQYGTS